MDALRQAGERQHREPPYLQPHHYHRQQRRPSTTERFSEEQVLEDFRPLEVVLPDDIGMDGEHREALRELLASDPRPHYYDDPERIYGFVFADRETKFRVVGA